MVKRGRSISISWMNASRRLAPIWPPERSKVQLTRFLSVTRRSTIYDRSILPDRLQFSAQSMSAAIASAAEDCGEAIASDTVLSTGSFVKLRQTSRLAGSNFFSILKDPLQNKLSCFYTLLYIKMKNNEIELILIRA